MMIYREAVALQNTGASTLYDLDAFYFDIIPIIEFNFFTTK